MIETIVDFQRFLDKESRESWIVHAVPADDGVHPSDTTPTLLFIRSLSSGTTYYYSIDHPDSRSQVSFQVFMEKILPLENIKWAFDKKAFLQLLPLSSVYDANFCGFVNKNLLAELYDFETPAHMLVKRNARKMKGINRAIPLMKHLEMFDAMCGSIKKMQCRLDNSTILVNDVILDALGRMECEGIYVDREEFAKHFSHEPNDRGLVYSRYNIYTSTGRPSNAFGGVNYAALNAKDGTRKSFVSRYGKDGRIVVVDYTAFHPRIVCKLVKYQLSLETDIYAYLGKLYFNKQAVDDTDVSEAKKLTFRQLYGGVEPRFKHIRYLGALHDYIDEQWKFFNANGYVETPFFKRKITDKHILDPDPPKVFNYILQAAEGEIAISRLQEVQRYLADKRTKAVMYTYDAILYDFHHDDGLETLNKIREIMSFNGHFPMKTYIGESYQSVRQISL